MAGNQITYNDSQKDIPVAVQTELKIVTELICSTIEKVVMVWLFGSYARGEAINDRRIDPETGTISEYMSDVDVLVITQGMRVNDLKTEKRWQNLIAEIDKHPKINSHIHLIYESLERVNEALSYSEFFYRDVVKEGIVLFNDGITLSSPKKMLPEDRRNRSIAYLNEIYEQANGFKQGVELYYQLGNLRLTIFSLHQMAEHLFKTYLLVFTHYKPRTHNLLNMLVRVASIDKNIENIFPRNSKESESRFHFLVNSYVNARYKFTYEVDIEVLDYLIERVANFQRWMLAECLKCIDSLVPDNKYSDSFQQIGEFLDLKKLKDEPMPQVVVYQQLEALKLQVEEMKVKDEKLLEKDKKLRTKERRLAEERRKRREAQERAERAEQRLRDAGLEP